MVSSRPPAPRRGIRRQYQLSVGPVLLFIAVILGLAIPAAAGVVVNPSNYVGTSELQFTAQIMKLDGDARTSLSQRAQAPFIESITMPDI